jgi:hypothetical protein
MRRAVPLLAAMLASACVAPRATPPSLDAASVAQAQTEIQRTAIATQIDRFARAQRLAWPILTANTDLCRPRIELGFGLMLTDTAVIASLVPGLKPAHIKAAGFDGRAQVSAITPNGPAAKAGLLQGDRFLRIGKTTLGGSASAAQVSTALSREGARGAVMDIEVQGSDGNMRALRLAGVNRCAFPLNLRYGDAINASTNGRSMTLLTGLMRGVDDDALVQFVIAHELAHALLRHPQRGATASVASGAALLGAVGASSGWLIDRGAQLFGQRPRVSYEARGRALAVPFSPRLEREADYVGLYLAARAGVDISQSEKIFEHFSTERPIGSWLQLTHPITPERLVALRAARAEIEAKRTRGEPLLPTGFSPPAKSEPRHGHSQRP